MVKIKKHGWILQAENGKFVKSNGIETKQIHLAVVCHTREQARTGNFDPMVKLDTDVVRKVELHLGGYKNGKAKKIISGR